MRILYVTSLWGGFGDLVLRDRREPSGMPGFVRPLQKLLELGHQVDLVIAVPQPAPLAVGPAWLRSARIELVPWRGRQGLGPLTSPAFLMRAVARACRRARYDFVYGHGRLGSLACLVARRHGIPCGQRLYGRGLSEAQLRQPRFMLCLRDPLEYLSLTAPKDFLLVTHDGPYGEIFHQRFGHGHRFEFLLWRNGCDVPPRATPAPPVPPYEPFLFFPARIVPWKRQDLGVALLRALHGQGHRNLHLYFAGPVDDPVYWHRIQSEIGACGLSPFVHHLGKLAASQLLPYYRRSRAVLALYAEASFGNVVIEALAAGSVVVALDRGALASIITDGTTGVLADSIEDAARRLDTLLRTPRHAEALAAAAAAAARRLFEPWNTRVMREIELIARCATPRRAARDHITPTSGWSLLSDTDHGS